MLLSFSPEPKAPLDQTKKKRPSPIRVLMMNAGNKPMRTPNDYRIAIVTALEVEMSAVRFMLDNEHDELSTDEDDPNIYILGDLQGHNVVLACLPGAQGKGSAATVATNLARSFLGIKWRFFVGIGGGVPTSTRDIRLGDVVVSMPEGQYGGVVQYDLRRDTEGGFQLKGFLKAPPTKVQNAIGKMKSDRVRKNKIDEFISTLMDKGYEGLQEYERPADKEDLLFKADYSHTSKEFSCRHCDYSKRVERPSRHSNSPKIHYGLIASGDSVIMSSATRNKILEDIGEVLCFEMEAAGIMTEFSCIVIRGISDYADSHKNFLWQGYAAATAAACAKELLSYLKPEEAISSVISTSSSAISEPLPDHQPYASNIFRGRGIQHTSSGYFSVGKDLNIH